ncbi:uncharacterized protein A4U43_C09F4580 [Asparagus officinalis]|uniref:Vacuolar protein sorting-associated protein 62 n=1 Tax=Asparagus officinalis TaxID=4686 RepID=A0A5P1E8N3_ASPOF|nr:vacuolar protein sorting-associated protein 62-like [Asparagus officinalis]ONK57827.1 uncharacterized protein A4U43_C09F4580 [Asparagus officinalis]
MMDGLRWFCWNRGRGGAVYDRFPTEPEPFSLPSPIPQWPKGEGFGQGSICIGELEIVGVTKFERVWRCYQLSENTKGAVFCRPVDIKDGFFCLGHYAQPVDQPLRGFVLAAKEITASRGEKLPALQKPIDYTLIWSSDDGKDDTYDGCGYFWLPCPPEGYKAMGYVVTREPGKPSLEEIRCVRADLTDTCEAHGLIVETSFLNTPLRVWKTRPAHRGIWGRGVSVGTFFCGSSKDDMNISCLNNLDSSLHAMPNLDQIHAVINHYGPTVFFHPEERYLPSSVSWFFKNGATLYKKGKKTGEIIDSKGSNLPNGGGNDGDYWIDLPDDDRNNIVKCGDIESAELYVHVKPAIGGTFTDFAMWVFCPFNGPGTLKISLASFPFSKVGQHVGDWEHFTLRVCNYTGELWSIYFSQHSGGVWVDTYNLEFIKDNKAIVYSTKNGHASFPHAGCYLQGSEKLGIGIRNDAEISNFFVDSSIKYQIIAAEYLGDAVTEPSWLQYMREWGPTIKYNSKCELDKILKFLPLNLRYSVESIFDKLPIELYGEEGPTGPKEKNNWVGDERW